MDITKHTFDEKLDTIISDIEESAFLAIDGEFTGLDLADCGHAAPFDTPEERYWKIRQGASDFLLIQFGLCAFKVDEENQRYEAKPYNFYIFPRPYNRHAPDRRFLCQSSSIEFLTSHGFDFNKLFKEGIPYLTVSQENRLREELERKHEEANQLMSPDAGKAGSAKKGSIPIPNEQKAFLDGICAKISTYLESEDPEPLIISSGNAFQRKLIYQTLEEKFPSVHVETKTGEKKERYMVVSKTKDDEERLQKTLEKQAAENMELDIQVGFSKVMRAITRSGKLVVGHNMFLDIIHSVNQFQCPLPHDLDEFKTVVLSLFPRLIDTKLMASTHPFKEHITFSSLDEVRLTLQQPPFSQVKVETAEGFKNYDEGGGSYHEAGFDAFITGKCFATMVKYLGTFQDPPVDFQLPTSHVVEPFVNKLFLMRIADIPYLNLTGADLEMKRDHVFHVTFPREWRPSDLHSLFQPYGPIQISWLTDTTAYIALYKKENSVMALKALSQEIGNFQVVSFASHHCNRSVKVSTDSGGNKRRCIAGADVQLPPSKVSRQSLTQEVKTAAVITEEEEDMDCKSQENSTSKSQEGSVSDEPKPRNTQKVFEEVNTW